MYASSSGAKEGRQGVLSLQGLGSMKFVELTYYLSDKGKRIELHRTENSLTAVSQIEQFQKIKRLNAFI